MSAVQARRALQRLAAPEAALMLMHGGAYGVYPRGDRRRRPLARLSGAQVRDYASAGVIKANDAGVFALTEAGRALLRRESAAPDEAYLHQHGELSSRAVIDAEGALHEARALDAGAFKRLKALRAADGSPWLSREELLAAARLHEDWALGQIGLVRGSNWSAPPRGGAARGPGNAREGALASHCDARARVELALDALAAPLRRVVERVCLREEGLEALERAESWPARSGKIALKLGLAQLARGQTKRAR